MVVLDDLAGLLVPVVDGLVDPPVVLVVLEAFAAPVVLVVLLALVEAFFGFVVVVVLPAPFAFEPVGPVVVLEAVAPPAFVVVVVVGLAFLGSGTLQVNRDEPS